MSRQSAEDELEIAARELKKAFQNFEKAAKKFLAVMDGMGKGKHRKLKEFSEETQQIQEFLIQMQDQEGAIKEKVLRLKCALEKDHKQK